MKKLFCQMGFFLAVSIVLFAACSNGEQSGATEEASFTDNHGQAGVVDDVSKKNILQIALGSPDHTTLVAAVKAAELENVLVNPGPLTVFAPTNAAFDKLPAGTVEDLLKPENKQKLYNILVSHAAPGTFYVDKDLTDGSQIYQASGHYLDVEVKDGSTYVNGVKILASIDASNGVVHVIDEVFLLPEK
jgi:uncharacterized surface protein with fasciclin (FAS1) repeats